MAKVVDPRVIRTQFESLAKSAYLDVLLPKSSDFDAAALLKTGSIEDLRQAPSRRNLFLDERACVILVLKTSSGQDEVQQLLPSLKITLAAHATDAVPQGQGSNAASASGKHDLTSTTCSADQDVQLVTAGDSTFAVWKLELHLARPKARLQRPAIYFTANIVVRTESLEPIRKSGSAYLPAYEPLPTNILAPLQFDPALRGSNINLSENRITKVAPTTRTEDVVKPIRGASRRAFPTVPAIFTRIRYSSLPDAVFASLHLEISQVMAGTVQINSINLDSSSHTLESVNSTAWPKQASAGDELVSIFRIIPQTGTNIPQDTISISISAVATLDQGSTISLHITWQAHIDLSAAMAKPTYKWSRPLSSSSLQQARLSTQTASSRPTSSASSGPTHPPLAHDPGIILNISGPATVRAEEAFLLAIQCINHSSRSRRFGLVVVPTKRTRQHPPPPPPLQQSSAANNSDLLSKVFGKQYVEPPKPADVLDMNPDVRIGPLPPGACYETQLRFRAVALGVLELGMLRVIDLETRQSLDVRELPDIIAVEEEE